MLLSQLVVEQVVFPAPTTLRFFPLSSHTDFGYSVNTYFVVVINFLVMIE
jgi:hypothetical protein